VPRACPAGLLRRFQGGRLQARALARDLGQSHAGIATYHCYDPWFFASGAPRNAAEEKWGADEQKVEYVQTMDRVKKWSDAHKVPVYLGEWATSIKCAPASRLEYYRFVPAQAAARGFSDAIWDDGGDMQIYDRKNRKWNTDILHAVFP